ncbi:eukaryotic aspartyl protease family protein [Striga asiatica]|uniref:Eukaryotic aspartyl protease family protein n=1 Tax=Striga asiatica TaxID=4170 RepID=A0A5A7NWY1_STRAF|nr:eukaryotic aspartyl protease family protein [Striga asiatica]
MINLVKSNGFTIELINPYSSDSLFFETNISHEQRIKFLASRTIIRANYFSKKSPIMQADVEVQLFHYIVKIGIGTFKSIPQYKEYYLHLDTGSSLTWLQCNGCKKCFNQTQIPFPKEKSSSFRALIEKGNQLGYVSVYGDGDITSGILAHETFYFKTKKGLEKIENVQFGCGLDNVMEYGEYKNNKIAGIMGIGWGDLSLVNQLGPEVKGKFSYCLPVIISEKAPKTYLRFGDYNYTANHRIAKSTPLYRRGKEFYAVEMQGISINKTRLKIDPQVFVFKRGTHISGCITDMGTAYSRIITPAFEILKRELEKYFLRFKDLKKFKDDSGLELCYARRSKGREGFKNLPDVTFHLQGSRADFVLKPNAVFEVISGNREYFCLAMVSDDEIFTLTIHNALVKSTGLKIKIIHPYSPESPFFYQNNLTHEERIKRSALQSNLQFNQQSKTQPLLTETRIETQQCHYILKIGIGTFKSDPPYKEYYLEMDTGSSLVWLQCQGCTKCFNQTPQPFPAKNSASCRPILDKKGPKQYDYEYQDGAFTRGVLAHETFHFRSKTGKSVKFPNIQFGCGLQNVIQYDKIRNNKIAGIIGMGWEDQSFVKQLGPKINSKFSYCLPSLTGKPSNAYLVLGDNGKPQPKSSSQTPLLRTGQTSPYYVALQDISVNKNRLRIKPEVFLSNSNNFTGGCIIDTGTPYSRIIMPAFKILVKALENYFSSKRGLKRLGRNLGLELCYERNGPGGLDGLLPEITFHLKGTKADFVVGPEAGFEIVGQRRTGARQYFCLAMVRDDGMTLIGTHQQANKRVIHDFGKKELVFYDEDCSKSP